MMRCRAVSVPMVMSVPQKSLSMEPTWDINHQLLSLEGEVSQNPYQSHNVQHIELLLLLGGNGLVLHQLLQQARPLLTEQIGAGKGAIASNHHQVGDALLDQIVGGPEATLTLTEILAASGANDGATAMDDGRDRGPVGLLNAVAAIHHALVALANEVDLEGGLGNCLKLI